MILKPASEVEGATVACAEECMGEGKITEFVSKIKNKEQNKSKENRRKEIIKVKQH